MARRRRAVSTDHFYGASRAAGYGRYGDGSAWNAVRGRDALVNMKTAASDALMERFAPDVERLAVRAVATPVDDVAGVAAMTAAAPEALRLALAGARGCFE